MYCRNCGNIVADNAMSCSSCGFNPAEGNNYCPKCGHFCIPGDVECVQCKTSLVAPAKLSVKKEGYSAAKPPIITEQPQATPQFQQPQPQMQQQPQPQMQQQPQPQMQQQPQPQAQSQQKYVETKVGPKFLASDQRYCRNCGLVIPAEAHKCPFCDSAAGSNYCHKCGSGTTSSDTVCSVCSSPLTLRPNVGYIPSQPPSVTQNSNTQGGYNQNGYNQQQNRQQYAPPQQNNQYNNGHYGNAYIGNNMYRNTETHDWLITLVLCFLVGYLGIHRFYTKNYAAGILQFFTGGGCGVWWLVDLILILVDGYTDGNGNKLKHS